MSRHHAAFGLLLSLYLILGALYARLTPPWQAPDEPAHYNYIRQLAGGDWPVIEPGDYDQAYQSQVISSRFAPGYSVASFEYEDYQPPLYYLLLTPVYKLSGGQLVALRLSSVLLGAGVIGLAYAAVRRIYPTQSWLALSVAAVIAFVPQHVAMLGAVNNDSLAELLIVAMLYILAAAWPDRPTPLSTRRAWTLGLLLGAGLLTKVTVYLMVPVLALAVWQAEGWNWRGWLRRGGYIFGPALLLGGVWWWRNSLVYGGLDPLGIAAHDAVVTGQPTTTAWVQQFGWAATWRAFLTTTFHSFWGQFGWMGAPMPGWVYGLLGWLSVLAVVGVALLIWRPALAPAPSPPPHLRAILGALTTLNVALYLFYNVKFVQHQGRYLFPSLLPLALAASLGWAIWLRPLYRRQPGLAYLLPLGLAIGLAGLDVLALFRFILPQLAG